MAKIGGRARELADRDLADVATGTSDQFGWFATSMAYLAICLGVTARFLVCRSECCGRRGWKPNRWASPPRWPARTGWPRPWNRAAADFTRELRLAEARSSVP